MIFSMPGDEFTRYDPIILTAPGALFFSIFIFIGISIKYYLDN